ncbi:MAG: bifunctional pyr operon transcriptional regulator/uracil phosphoribosyltransferase PyrR [Ferruginibacter sp.]|nr:bifunctional pyr operon transcriptional regulator/uracil phosphoribosyltransferase PyrR [Ferruginibacter sp.]
MEVILTHQAFRNCIETLAQEILGRRPDMSNTAIVGIQQGGVVVAEALYEAICRSVKGAQPDYGQIDITFYRDDLHKQILQPDKMNLPFSVDDKHILLVDDVLFTGRTIKAALDVLLDYGRPGKVELCVLVDRAEHRQFPIQADYRGITPSTASREKIKLLKEGNTGIQVVRFDDKMQ